MVQAPDLQKRLTLGSPFDGIGGFPLAAVQCDIESIWAVKLKGPASDDKKRYPAMFPMGDIAKLKGTEKPPVGMCFAFPY